MHNHSYHFISPLRPLLYVQITQDSSQCEVSLYTHYQRSTTGHSTRAYHHRVCVLVTRVGSISSVCEAAFTAWQGGKVWPRQSLLPAGMCQSTSLLLCIPDLPLGLPTPAEHTEPCAKPPIPSNFRKFWVSLGRPAH